MSKAKISRFRSITLGLSAGLFCASTSVLAETQPALPDCPRQIILEQLKLPGDADLARQFKDTFHVPGVSIETFEPEHLLLAQELVAAIQHRIDHGKVTLWAAKQADGQCTGRIGAAPFTYDGRGGSMDFDFASPAPILGSGVHIGIGADPGKPFSAGATFFIEIPSNCSGCQNTTALFEAGRVSFK